MLNQFIVYNFSNSDFIYFFNSQFISLPFYTRNTYFLDLILIFLPEFSLFLIIIIYFCTYFFKQTRTIFLNFTVLFFLLFCLLFLFFFSLQYYNYEFFLISSYYIWLTKLFLTLFSIFFIYLHFYQCSFAWYKNHLIDIDLGSKYFEVNIIVIVALLSSFFVISSNDFLIFLISIEVFAMCTFIIASLTYEKISIESTLKYFFVSIFFSFFLLFGICLIYWSTFSLNFSIINDVILYFKNLNESLSNSIFFYDTNIHYYNLISNKLLFLYYKKIKWVSCGLLFIFISLLCKIGLFPGQFWVLDVYGNISVLSNAYLSIIPKLVYMVILIRFNIHFFYLYSYTSVFSWLFLISGVLSIIYGSFVTLNQWRIKKFMAGSSITNLGFLLLMFIGITKSYDYLSIFIFLKLYYYYLIIYLISTAIFFYVYIIIIQPNYIKLNFYFEDFREFIQLKTNYKLIVLIFSLLFLSFAGIPPLVGFFPKIFLFNYFLYTDLTFILFFILFFSIITAFYYIRIIRFILFSNTKVFSIFLLKYNWLFYIIIGLILIFLFSFSAVNFHFINFILP